jgi:chorismate lyase
MHAPVYASWHPHVNHVNPPRALRSWLTDDRSLTLKLMLRSRQFQIRRLCQRRALCLVDEHARVGLQRRSHVRQREVLLQCDGQAVVFAHTVVPLAATTSDWPFFGGLGERSLGTTLFGDPRVGRCHMEYARLHARHPLVRRAQAALGKVAAPAPLYARRCLYHRRRGVLLVTELFLPPILAMSGPAPEQIDTHGFR